MLGLKCDRPNICCKTMNRYRIWDDDIEERSKSPIIVYLEVNNWTNHSNIE